MAHSSVIHSYYTVTTKNVDLPLPVGGVLQLPDLLGGPRAQRFRLASLGPPALDQKVRNRLVVEGLQHLGAKRRNQIPVINQLWQINILSNYR